MPPWLKQGWIMLFLEEKKERQETISLANPSQADSANLACESVTSNVDRAAFCTRRSFYFHDFRINDLGLFILFFFHSRYS